MTPPPPPRTARPFPPWLEWALALAVLAALAIVAVRFVRDGYLPQPFFYDVTDPLMDLYSTAYWAHHPGAYSVWASVYPPLSFAFLRLISIPGCYVSDPFWARDCDWLARYALYALYALDLAVIYGTYRKADRVTALPRSIALGLSLPMLYGLDRGNLVIPCFAAFALGYGRLLSRERSRIAALAVAVHFKPYLLLVALPRAAARHWRWLAVLGALLGAVYVVTYAVYGGGAPWELIRSARTFSAVTGDNFWEKIYASTSFAPLLRFAASDFPLLQYVDSRVADRLAVAFSAALWAGVLATGAVYVAALRAPGRVSPRRLAASTICLLLALSESSGPYALIFPLFLVFAERWKGAAGAVILTSAYLLCLPIDYTFLTVFQGPMRAWWSGREVYVEFGVAVGQFARPLLLLALLYALAWSNGRDLAAPGVARVPAPAC